MRSKRFLVAVSGLLHAAFAGTAEMWVGTGASRTIASWPRRSPSRAALRNRTRSASPVTSRTRTSPCGSIRRSNWSAAIRAAAPGERNGHAPRGGTGPRTVVAIDGGAGAEGVEVRLDRLDVGGGANGDDAHWGGLSIRGAARVRLSDSIVRHNDATLVAAASRGQGGGVSLRGTRASLVVERGVDIRDNKTHIGGGLGVEGGRVTILPHGVAIRRNQALGGGGGLAILERGSVVVGADPAAPGPPVDAVLVGENRSGNCGGRVLLGGPDSELLADRFVVRNDRGQVLGSARYVGYRTKAVLRRNPVPGARDCPVALECLRLSGNGPNNPMRVSGGGSPLLDGGVVREDVPERSLVPVGDDDSRVRVAGNVTSNGSGTSCYGRFVRVAGGTFEFGHSRFVRPVANSGGAALVVALDGSGPGGTHVVGRSSPLSGFPGIFLPSPGGARDSKRDGCVLKDLGDAEPAAERSGAAPIRFVDAAVVDFRLAAGDVAIGYCDGGTPSSRRPDLDRQPRGENRAPPRTATGPATPAPTNTAASRIACSPAVSKRTAEVLRRLARVAQPATRAPPPGESTMSFRNRLLYPAMLLCTSLADAATIVVDTLEDGGPGSLRAAIAQANDSEEADTIAFRQGLAGTLVLDGGELVVRGDLAIRGPGPTRLTIEVGQRGRAFRFENPAGTRANWALEGLTVSNGLVMGATGEDGGALHARSEANARLRSKLSLAELVLTGNAASRYGGAVATSGIDLALDRVSLVDNQAGHGGGGLYFDGGSLRVERSRVAGNQAGSLVGGLGGGLLLLGTDTEAAILDSTIQTNSASRLGGGAFFSVLTLSIQRSSFVENTVVEGGGGAYLSTAAPDAPAQEYRVENSTFSANRTTDPAAAGSAIAVLTGRLAIRNSTLAFNRASQDAGPAPAGGAALWIGYDVADATVQSTLFASNTSGASGVPNDLARERSPGSVLRVGNSLFGAYPPVGVITEEHANLEADARLGDLTYKHGGFVPVHPLAADSPAIDRGDNPGSLVTDQRGDGFARTWSAPGRIDGKADIGAYEHRADAPFADGFEGPAPRPGKG